VLGCQAADQNRDSVEAPTKTDKLPSGSQWLHEIKHDGFRIIAERRINGL